ncbi:hypothetical protein NDU88_004267 [Pleurodeles waltl]|uniref:Uncharacterized protein n=1 Tax=Pleurodeles waltl TaxID=8319 RepID=A0AAV7T6Y3_PLEWA|nr:hypothetical protein NDU88_004267 [Pleurodeles waltl]
MEAETDSILRRLRLQTAGSASAGGGASSGGCRVQDVSCSLGRLPTGDAADVRCSGTGWACGCAYGGAGGGACSGVCGGDAAGAAHGAGAGSSGGRHQAISSSLGWLPTGDDAGDCRCGSGGAGGAADGGAGGGCCGSAYRGTVCWPVRTNGGLSPGGSQP